jgi:hypothetical protein
MKLLIFLSLFFGINLVCKSQTLEKKESIPVSKNEIIKDHQQVNSDKEKLKTEEIEKLKISKSTPVVFYIINDKPVSREAYMLYLSEEEKKKEKNPNKQ